MEKINSSWYAIYTKPFWEKKIAALLETAGVLSYCPLQKIQRQWSDRKKTIYTPLFTSYVFIYINESQKALVRQISGVINFVNSLGRPAVIRDHEIEAIKKFNNDYEDIEVRKAPSDKTTAAKIISRQLSDLQASIKEVGPKRVELHLPGLGCTLTGKVAQTNYGGSYQLSSGSRSEKA